MHEQSGVGLDPSSGVAADALGYAISIFGVFVAANMQCRRWLVVWAKREGRQYAQAIAEINVRIWYRLHSCAASSYG